MKHRKTTRQVSANVSLHPTIKQRAIVIAHEMGYDLSSMIEAMLAKIYEERRGRRGNVSITVTDLSPDTVENTNAADLPPQREART